MSLPANLEGAYISICGALREPTLADLTVRQLGVMMFIANKSKTDIYSTKDIHELLGLSKPAITRACDTLQELGYVVRKAHPLDRRMVSLTLTNLGTRYLNKMAKVSLPIDGLRLAA
jgi:DNA-binding MarR family transcriptional regulator